MYYANEETDEVIGGFTKTIQHSVKNISRNFFEQCSSNLAPDLEQNCTYGYAVGPALIKTKIPRFYLKQGIYPRQTNGGEVRQYGDHVCSKLDPLSHFQISCKRGFLVFHRKRLEPRWQKHIRCHSVSFVMYSSGARFEEHCSNISRDILD